LLLRQAAWHATLLHPFLYAVDLKRALSFGEAQHFNWSEFALTFLATGAPWMVADLKSF
jgi:hypothetical protein